jgi:hypothetical protein
MDIQLTKEEVSNTLTELTEQFLSIEDSKINTVPFTDSWTAGQLIQHVILSAGGMVQLVNGPVSDTKRDPEEHIPKLRKAFLDFNTKMKSPDFIVPEFKNYNRADLIKKLRNIKDELLNSVQILDLEETCTLFEMPNLGYLTRAEAIEFAIVHTQRHVHQLKNIIKHLR